MVRFIWIYALALSLLAPATSAQNRLPSNSIWYADYDRGSYDDPRLLSVNEFESWCRSNERASFGNILWVDANGRARVGDYGGIWGGDISYLGSPNDPWFGTFGNAFANSFDERVRPNLLIRIDWPHVEGDGARIKPVFFDLTSEREAWLTTDSPLNMCLDRETLAPYLQDALGNRKPSCGKNLPESLTIYQRCIGIERVLPQFLKLAKRFGKPITDAEFAARQMVFNHETPCGRLAGKFFNGDLSVPTGVPSWPFGRTSGNDRKNPCNFRASEKY